MKLKEFGPRPSLATGQSTFPNFFLYFELHIAYLLQGYNVSIG